MANNLLPLNYAIIKLFTDGKDRSAQDVVNELKPEYGGYRLLTLKDVDEALSTAKENGLLDEVSAELNGSNLKITYQLNSYGRDLVDRFIG